MRSLLIFLMAAGLFAACKPKNQVTIKTDDGSTGKMDVQEMTKAADEYQKRAEELKKLPPLTLDQLKALIPATLGGLPRTDLSVNTAMGTAVGTAKYRQDTAELELVIYDGGGEGGGFFFTSLLWGNYETENANGYSKTTQFNGNKAVEAYQKGSNEYTLTFPASDRLIVVVKGENTGLDKVKEAAGSLNLKVN